MSNKRRPYIKFDHTEIFYGKFAGVYHPPHLPHFVFVIIKDIDGQLELVPFDKDMYRNYTKEHKKHLAMVVKQMGMPKELYVWEP